MRYFAKKPSLKSIALAGCAAIALIHGAAAAQAASDQPMEFAIAAQPLADALTDYALQSGREVYFLEADVAGLTAPELDGTYRPLDAFERLLAGSGIAHREAENGVLLVGDTYTRADDNDAPTHGASAVAGTYQGGAQPVSAQGVQPVEADGAEDEGEDGEAVPQRDVIVVTGTNIRGAAPVGSPLLQFDREDIDLTGAGSLQDFFETVPQNFGGGPGEVQGNNNGNTLTIEDGTAINLRGLGSGSTLVLLNGNRLAGSTNGTYVDTSMIPISAVDRIDILTDGASAIYGSDAISGVVNIVLRDDFDGAETRFRYGTVTEGGQREYRAAQTLGRSWTSGHVLASYDYRDRSALSTDERSFTVSKPGPSSLVPEQESHSLLGVISQDLGQQATVGFSAFYTTRESSTIFTNPSNDTTFTDGDTQQLNVAGGLGLGLGQNWFVDASFSYSQADRSSVFETPSTSFFQISEGTTSTLTFDAQLSGDVLELPGGPIQVALGAQYREDDLDRETITTRSGVQSPPDAGNSGREVRAAFAEAIIPIIGSNNRLAFAQQITLSLAGRYEDYSDFGDTFDPKIGVLFVPLDGVALRASYGTSFKAPLLVQFDAGTSVATVLNLPFIPDPNSPAGFSPFILLQGANADLFEERSENWTVGVDFEPSMVPGFNLELTYFDIRFEDRIGTPASGFEVTQILADPRYAPVVTRNPDIGAVQAIANSPNFSNFRNVPLADITAIADNRIQNLSTTEVNGLDFSATYAFESGLGRVSTQLAGSYYFEFANQLTSTSPLIDVVDTVFNPVDLELRAIASLDRGSWGGSLALEYTDSYTNTEASPAVPVESWTTFDMQVRYSFDAGVRYALLQNSQFRLNINNLFNEDPPFVDAGDPDFFFDGANASPIGRYISLDVVKTW